MIKINSSLNSMDSRRDTHLLSCSLCFSNGLQVVTKISHCVNHLRVFHAHQQNFKVTCGIDGCVRTFTNIWNVQESCVSGTLRYSARFK